MASRMAVRKSQTLRLSRRSKDTDPTPSAPGEEPVVTAVRIVSLDPKAKKAGGLAVALKGVIVRPNDEVDAEKEYGLIAVPE